MSHVFEVVSKLTKNDSINFHVFIFDDKYNFHELWVTLHHMLKFVCEKIATQIISVRTSPRVGRKILLSMKMIFVSLKIIFGALAI